VTQSRHIATILTVGVASLASNFATAAETVTVDNFVRAEIDMTLKRYVAKGSFGTIVHTRQPISIDKQDIVRMNRDTLYSSAVFDPTTPVTIFKPDSGGRFQSMQVVSQDHYMLPTEHGAGEFTLTREKVGTRYVFVIFRTFMDPANPEDIRAANALQDKIRVTQASVGKFEVPDWDEKSLATIRDAIKVLASTKSGEHEMFGAKGSVDPINHLIGAAVGWGGNSREAAVYISGVPAKNDGKTAYVLTAKDVPVDGFWSVTVYNAKGFMEKNDLGAYSYNNVTAKKDKDGGITIHFGGDPRKPNYLPITKGWNYVVRLYQPRKELIDGRWHFPDAQPTK